MATHRSDVDQQVAELLRTAKTSLRMSVTFLTRMDGTTQTLEVVDSSVPLLFREGARAKQETSLCQAVLDGRLPPVLPDLTDFPVAMTLPAARLPVVPAQRTSAERPSRWTPWSPSRGRRRAEQRSDSYPGV